MDPEELVTEVEATYESQDVDRMMELFDPEIALYWNGRLRAEGFAEVRAEHEGWYGEERDEYQVRKRLRAESGDTLAVEFTTSWIDDDGNRKRGHGGEFWTMRDNRLLEWHAYYQSHELDETEEGEADPYLTLSPWVEPNGTVSRRATDAPTRLRTETAP